MFKSSACGPAGFSGAVSEVVYSLMDGVHASEHARLPLRHPLGCLGDQSQLEMGGSSDFPNFSDGIRVLWRSPNDAVRH